MPNTIFSCQTTFEKAKFLKFGLKNSNLATLLATLIIARLLLPNHPRTSNHKNCHSHETAKPLQVASLQHKLAHIMDL